MTLDLKPKLSANDSQVLAALFDPESSLSANPADVEQRQLTSDSPDFGHTESSILSEEHDALHLLNAHDPSLADIEQALGKLTRVCEEAPDYASAWCNRAQATRLFLMKSQIPPPTRNEGVDLLSIALQHAELFQRMFRDLDQAINLATPKTLLSSSTSPGGTALSIPSSSQARVLAAAHTHRGYLLWQFSRANIDFDAHILPSPLSGMNKDSLEAMANREFSLGGRYGNEIAKKLSVQTNPYAKLCGSIVREAMRKEIEEQSNYAANL